MGDGIKAIEAGGSHTCAINADNHAYCWGLNNNGQVGNNTATTAKNPVRVKTPGNGETDWAASITSIQAGEYGTCALSGGKVFCWGKGDSGLLGNGTTAGDKTIPVAVRAGTGGSPLFQTSGVSTITTGYTHNCAVGTTGAYTNQLFCWGNSFSGKLGIGASGNLSLPQPVTLP